MQLLPTIVVFIIVSLILVGIFSLISFVYFRIKRRRSLNALAEAFSPNDNLDNPYIEMTPLNSSRVKDKQDFELDIPTPKAVTKGNINLSNIKNTRTHSFSVSVPQINNSKTLQTTAVDYPQLDQKYSYTSKLIKYTSEGIQLSTSEVFTVVLAKVFKNLAWQTTFQSQPIINHSSYPSNSPNFTDLLDIFKLEIGQYKCIKFIVEVVIKNCNTDKTYYLDDMQKTERVQVISEEEYQQIRKQFQKS